MSHTPLQVANSPKSTKKNRRKRKKPRLDEILAVAAGLADAPDDFGMDAYMTCIYWGGSKPIHPATLYRGIKAGRIPAPEHMGKNLSRWTLGKCRRAKAQIDSPEGQ